VPNNAVPMSHGADMRPFTWSVVIPVKVLNQAKSRLGQLGAQRRAELALAMAADTVIAVGACEQVTHMIVVTDDEVAADALAALGATVIADQPAGGLNAALVHGAAHVRAVSPENGIAALFADLPAVRPEEIGRALTAAAAWPTAFVADTAGDGTTMYTARPGSAFRPAFGAASRARHAAGGAAELDLTAIPGLRQDVDTPEDLTAATAIGLGRNTADLLRCGLLGK
jgi:2-phospho-L-lactate/phosphoenolpyruvate guanylyltransferase